MKIALLTMTFNNNYGGYLQAYSLMSYLKELGHEVEMLNVQLEDKEFKTLFKTKIKNFIKRNIVTYFIKKYENAKYEKIFIKHKDQIEIKMLEFNDKYIQPKTRKIFSLQEFDETVEDKYDAYIVGSDQVWRPIMYKFFDKAFLGFVKNEKAILLSYAASFGIDELKLNDIDIEKYKKQIQRFKAVSVREKSGIEICRNILNTYAELVLDPTMIIDKSYYDRVIEDESKDIPGELLTYILDDNSDKTDIINYVTSKLNLKAFRVNPKPPHLATSLDEVIYPSIGYWLKGFENAKYVVTDSFHGTVFSIIYNKPFIAIGNKGRGIARFNSLLKMFGLEDRLIFDDKSFNKSLINKEIDWEKVNKKLEDYRKISKEFLVNNLGNTK